VQPHWRRTLALYIFILPARLLFNLTLLKEKTLLNTIARCFVFRIILQLLSTLKPIPDKIKIPFGSQAQKPLLQRAW
jgi:hypothetical protein